MTGPEHFQEAENILRLVAEPSSKSTTDAALLLGIAQVHAKLADAAANAAKLLPWGAHVAAWEGVLR